MRRAGTGHRVDGTCVTGRSTVVRAECSRGTIRASLRAHVVKLARFTFTHAARACLDQWIRNENDTGLLGG